MNNDINNNDFDIKANESMDDIAEVQRKAKRTKIIIIAVFAVMVAFMVLCFTVPGLLDGTAFEKPKNTQTPTQYIFHEPKPEGFDIMQYEKYINLDRGFHYRNDYSAQTDELLFEDLDDYNPGVTVIYNMIQAIVAGDNKAYNALLSDKMEKKKEFTQQQVYNISVVGITNTSSSGTFEFRVEYMIRENNGSFRTDIGSDMAKIQYFTVKLIDGKYVIDSITESQNK